MSITALPIHVRSVHWPPLAVLPAGVRHGRLDVPQRLPAFLQQLLHHGLQGARTRATRRRALALRRPVAARRWPLPYRLADVAAVLKLAAGVLAELAAQPVVARLPRSPQAAPVQSQRPRPLHELRGPGAAFPGCPSLARSPAEPSAAGGPPFVPGAGPSAAASAALRGPTLWARSTWAGPPPTRPLLPRPLPGPRAQTPLVLSR